MFKTDYSKAARVTQSWQRPWEARPRSHMPIHTGLYEDLMESVEEHRLLDR